MKKTRTDVNATRHQEPRAMLEARRDELTGDLQERVRRQRELAASSASADVQDVADFAEADMQEELRFSLMQLKTEMLERVQDALTRLDTGHYGVCIECDGEIAERRLRALPFATRCVECETDHERHARQTQTSLHFGGSEFTSR